MRPLKFRPPNFRCETTDPENRTDVRLAHAASEVELRARFDGTPFKLVSFDPYDFEEWKRRAEAETTRAIDAAKTKSEYKFRRELWQELKSYLFSISHGCCAYCEAFVLDVSDGDVEHFRPKARVDDDPTHGGYYWLAYDEKNFLPSCGNCNRTRGKANHFPVSDETARARTHGDDVATESPLLLNPFVEPPQKHLRYVAGGPSLFVGMIEAKTPMGETSRKIYGLNRGDLVEARRRAEAKLWTEYRAAFHSNTLRDLIRELRQGKREYSFAALSAIEQWWAIDRANVDEELAAETSP